MISTKKLSLARIPFWLLFALILALAAGWKALFVLWGVFPFNGDEAVVALMARHILQGARPVFFYGQAYMGSLDAFLVAAGFAIFGEQVWVIRLVQGLLYLGVIATAVWLGTALFGSRAYALIAGLLMAIPAVNVTLYTTASLGGYGEALLIGCLILLLAWNLAERIEGESGSTPYSLFAVWGGLVGLGLWTNGLTLVFSAPAGLFLLVFLLRRRSILLPFLACAGIGFLAGSLPWWLFARANGVGWLVQELFGSAVQVETDPWLARAGKHVLYFLLFAPTVVFGFRPPWSVDWLALPLLPLVLFFWAAVLWFWVRGLRKGSQHRRAYALLAGVGVVLFLAFVFTSFGADVSGRYFLPLAVPLALIASQALRAVSRRKAVPALLLGLVLVYHAWGTIQCALRYPPGITTQFYAPTIVDHRYDAQLIDFLRAQNEMRGYTTYWVGYPLAFHSRETLVFTPRLPYHLDLRYTPRDDRYTPYGELVEASDRVAYITARHPALDGVLRDGFTALGVTWREQQIGDYRVFYDLSRAVRPTEIGLGKPR